MTIRRFPKKPDSPATRNSTPLAPTSTQEHGPARLVASVYGWRTYGAGCACCAPPDPATAADGQRQRPRSAVLAWRTRAAGQG